METAKPSASDAGDRRLGVGGDEIATAENELTKHPGGRGLGVANQREVAVVQRRRRVTGRRGEGGAEVEGEFPRPVLVQETGPLVPAARVTRQLLPFMSTTKVRLNFTFI